MATGPAAVADADAESLRVQAQVRADAEKRASARAARSPTKTPTKSMGWDKAAQALTPNAQADDVKACSLPGGVKAFIKAAEELSPFKLGQIQQLIADVSKDAGNSRVESLWFMVLGLG
jgi:hypothetical protein